MTRMPGCGKYLEDEEDLSRVAYCISMAGVSPKIEAGVMQDSTLPINVRAGIKDGRYVVCDEGKSYGLNEKFRTKTE